MDLIQEQVKPQSTVPYRVAKLVSEIFGPAPLATALLLITAFTAPTLGLGALAALIAVVFITGGPLAALIILARKGRITDRHVSKRTQRAPILLGTMVSILVGLALLLQIGAPHALIVMTLSILSGLLLVMLVNLVWKLSIHAAVSMFFAVALILAFPGAGAVLAVPIFAVPLVVGWSRIPLGAHTPLQVLAGYAAGLLIVVLHVAIS
jgi:membrane-associated phospholipid phosphatase